MQRYKWVPANCPGGGGEKGGQYPYSLHASRCGCLVRLSREEGGGGGV